jgi:hypothetical protein
MPAKIYGSYQHALNDAEVTVKFVYPSGRTDEAEVSEVHFKGVDIWDTLNPEDQAFLISSVVGHAKEHDAEERACAQEAKWEADREERLLA